MGIRAGCSSTSRPARWWRSPPWLSACRGGARRERRLPLQSTDAVRQCDEHKAPAVALVHTQRPGLSAFRAWKADRDVLDVLASRRRSSPALTKEGNAATGRALEARLKDSVSQLGDSSMVEQRTLTPLI